MSGYNNDEVTMKHLTLALLLTTACGTEAQTAANALAAASSQTATSTSLASATATDVAAQPQNGPKVSTPKPIEAAASITPETGVATETSTAVEADPVDAEPSTPAATATATANSTTTSSGVNVTINGSGNTVIVNVNSPTVTETATNTATSTAVEYSAQNVQWMYPYPANINWSCGYENTNGYPAVWAPRPTLYSYITGGGPVDFTPPGMHLLHDYREMQAILADNGGWPCGAIGQGGVGICGGFWTDVAYLDNEMYIFQRSNNSSGYSGNVLSRNSGNDVGGTCAMYVRDGWVE